ncbi:hypothetical protein RHE_CH01973 [Rhizobium etli CFN 42]|uniref:Uncharacterized protein n=1 Tax=Rhizobium etli (strain ATCC 51251 / DSM 11541 / JCM 21823 / NBRC 15573 / CFN 42) TaxID=347834 RepID=Q2K8S8_RHIEC|nr:hypothetical protein [Rhizobium etli]ABC90758.1 hypothetical protein RHE_CH01973 [Rhizobium etli CFN 42]
MDLKDELERLREHALTLDKAVKDLDYEIERAVHSVASGSTDTGRAISILRDRQNDQAGLMYDLGKTEAQIEDIENRIREQDERAQEIAAVERWEAAVPVAREDYLDWLRPVLDAPEPPEHDRDDRDRHHEGEERMLQDMHREDLEPEDYLDWWKSR